MTSKILYFTVACIIFFSAPSLVSAQSPESPAVRSWTKTLFDLSCSTLGLGCPCPRCPIITITNYCAIDTFGSNPMGSLGNVNTSQFFNSSLAPASLSPMVADCLRPVHPGRSAQWHNIDDHTKELKRCEKRIEIIKNNSEILVSQVIELSQEVNKEKLDNVALATRLSIAVNTISNLNNKNINLANDNQMIRTSLDSTHKN